MATKPGRLPMATPIPKNRAPFSLAELALATAGEVVSGGAEHAFVGVSSDSRAVVPGEVFVALRGETFDGHEHVAGAIARGARALIVEREVAVSDGVAVVRVADALIALGQLGLAHRLRWERRGLVPARPCVVGITGSAGKTTTRHATERLLALSGASVHSSIGNLNNRIGVPMTLLGLREQHALAVIEMGMNQPGEIAKLARIARPDIGVVTLVSEAHVSGVGSLGGVAKEKSDLLAALGAGGTAIVNGDDDWARAGLARSTAGRHIVYGECRDADVRLLERTPRGLLGSDVRIQICATSYEPVLIEARLPLLGRAGVYAALAALAVSAAREPAAFDRARLAALAELVPQLGGNEAGRLAAQERADGAIVIDDAYNANPASMASSIEAACEIARSLDRRLVLVLGPMFELGSLSDELHEAVGRRAAQAKPAAIVVAGAAAEPLARAAEALGAKVLRAADAAAAEAISLDAVAARDVVLVKASNSVGLSRVARKLMEVA